MAAPLPNGQALIAGGCNDRHRKTVQKCTSKLTSSPVKFTVAASIAAVLSRDGIVYPTG